MFFSNDYDFSLDDYQFSVLVWDVLMYGKQNIDKTNYESLALVYPTCSEPLIELVEGGTAYPVRKRLADDQIKMFLCDTIKERAGTLSIEKRKQYRINSILRKGGWSSTESAFVCLDPLAICQIIKELFDSGVTRFLCLNDSGASSIPVDHLVYDKESKTISLSYRPNFFFPEENGNGKQPSIFSPILFYFTSCKGPFYIRWCPQNLEKTDTVGSLISISY